MKNLSILFNIKCEGSDSNAVSKASGGYCRSVDEFMTLKCKLVVFKVFKSYRLGIYFSDFSTRHPVRMYISLINETTKKILRPFVEKNSFAGTYVKQFPFLFVILTLVFNEVVCPVN